MASPATLGSIGIGASAGGSVLGAFGKIFEGQSNSQMYNYKAGIADLNAKISLQNRDYALQAGDIEGGQYGIKAAQRGGAIRAAQGASGIDVGSGSSVDVRAGQQKIVDMDLGQIRANAARVAYGYSSEAEVQKAQGGLYRAAASNAQTAGQIGALGSLISGAGSVSDKWLQQKQYGLSSGNAFSMPTDI